MNGWPAWRWSWVGGVDMGLIGKVSRWAIGWVPGTIGGTIGHCHGLQVLVALSRHVRAAARHPSHVAEGQWGWRPQ